MRVLTKDVSETINDRIRSVIDNMQLGDWYSLSTFIPIADIIAEEVAARAFRTRYKPKTPVELGRQVFLGRRWFIERRLLALANRGWLKIRGRGYDKEYSLTPAFWYIKGLQLHTDSILRKLDDEDKRQFFVVLDKYVKQIQTQIG